MDNFIDILRSSNHHATLPRRHLFALLNDAAIPMSVVDITSELRTVDRSTVYRMLELFSNLGIVNEIWADGRLKYELSEEFKEHHHHIVCEVCGLVTDIISRDMEKILSKAAKRAGYKLTNHQVELSGLCSSHR